MSTNRMRVIALGVLLIAFGLGVQSSAQAQGECYPAPEGLVAWWPAEGNGNDIQNVYHATMVNGAGFTVGMVGDSFYLSNSEDPDDPRDQYVELPVDVLDGREDLTVEFWMMSSDPAGGIISGNRPWDEELVPPSGDNKFLIYAKDSGAHLWINTNYKPVTEAFLLNDGQWHHVAFTRDGVDGRLYVDGVERFSTTFPTGGIELRSPSWGDGALVLGQEQDGVMILDPAQSWGGLIDELSVYDRALQVGEIGLIFTADAAGKCKDEDGDGFRPPADCDETDPFINPDGIELPGNFVDENCDGNLGDCAPCFTWKNHGEYVRCVAHTVHDLVTQGYLAEEVADEFVSSAARSDIGKRGYTPLECQ